MSGWASFSMADDILDYFYRGVVISVGGSLYLRLLVAPSSRSGGGTETDYTGYSRLQLPRDTTIFTSAPANGQLSNGVVLTYPTPGSAGNGDLLAFDVVDTPSGAINKIYNGGPILPTKSIAVGLPLKFRIGSLTFTF